MQRKPRLPVTLLNLVEKLLHSRIARS